MCDSDFAYEKRKNFLSPAERSFFGVLEQVIDGKYYIFPKVRFEDIVQVKKGVERKKAYGLRGRIKSRHIDFVLCDKSTLEVQICIELDDTSHKRKDRIERDAFVDKVLEISSIPIVRITAQKRYLLEDIRSKLRENFL